MRTSILTVGTIATLAVVAAAVVPSHATAPGENGRIAFRRYLDKSQTTGALFTIDSQGNGERQVTHPPRATVDDDPDWAPDGSSLVFQRCAKNGACAIYTVGPDGRGLLRLSATCPAGAVLPRCRDEYGPSFSPDGRRVVFLSYSGGHGNSIVVTDRRGHDRHVLVPQRRRVEVLDPQLSPDGRQLLFVRHIENSFAFAIFVGDWDGSHLRQVTQLSLRAGDGPDWSPDGTWILFRSDVPRIGQSQIYLIHPDGTGLKRLTAFKPGTKVTSSSFSPDGDRIVFGATGIGGDPDVYVMRADGSGPRPVTRTKLWDSAPDWGPRT